MEKQLLKWVWLSHTTSSSTPAYGGGNGFDVLADKQINSGDSCNTVSIQMSNHIGTHVDAPLHFVADGTAIDKYQAQEWIFTKPLLIDIPTEQEMIVTVDHLKAAIPSQIRDADLVMIKTGIEQHRCSEAFWKNPPGFSPDICDYLYQRFPSFNTFGIDAISISSFAHRDIGRFAHQEFLGKGIRIIEDMALSNIDSSRQLKQVIALPFRFAEADGSPITVMAELI